MLFSYEPFRGEWSYGSFIMYNFFAIPYNAARRSIQSHGVSPMGTPGSCWSPTGTHSPLLKTYVLPSTILVAPSGIVSDHPSPSQVHSPSPSTAVSPSHVPGELGMRLMSPLRDIEVEPTAGVANANVGIETPLPPYWMPLEEELPCEAPIAPPPPPP